MEFLRDKNDKRQTSPANWGTTLDELRTLMGFFASVQGSLTAFLLNDPTDNSVTLQQFGVGDGATTQFQLIRTLGTPPASFNEPIVAPNVVTGIFDNGSPVPGGNFTVNFSTGVVTFTSAPPAAGHILTATFTYYFLVRFSEDSLDFENFLLQLWSTDGVKLVSVLL